MNWDHLRFFLAVAEAGSLQGAARHLGVNHSTAFRRINAFEQEVDARLFERLPDGYQLTLAGAELLDHAKRIANEFDELQLKILGKDFRPSGTVRITAPDNIAYEYLPVYLADFSASYPEIHFELMVGAENLDLTRREADIAIRATQAPPPHLIGRKVLTLKWGHFASEDYLARYGRPRNAKSIGTHWQIGADGILRSLAPFRAMESEKSSRVRMACSSLNAMAAMARAGHGIAVLPDDQIGPGLSRLFDTDPLHISEIWILTHPELRRTERIRLLIDHLTNAFRSDDRIPNVAAARGGASRGR